MSDAVPSGWQSFLRIWRGARSVPRTSWTAPTTWRPTLGSAIALLLGLSLFGVGEGLLLAAGLGATPWSVFAQGVSLRTGITIGAATFVISCAVLLFWLPLRERPGLGTVSNVVVIAAVLELTVRVVPTPTSTAIAIALVLLGIAVIGVGSGWYLTSGHGPGPRDGLMTGIHKRTGWPVGVVRLGIELSVLIIGYLLGGTIGIGTALFALLIGQAVALGLALAARVSRTP